MRKIYYGISIFLSSCYTMNYHTRYQIDNFSIENIDYEKGIMDIKFNVSYILNEQASLNDIRDSGYLSLEKGLWGCMDTILYFGIPNIYACNEYINTNDSMTFVDFANGVTNNEREFSGERFYFPYRFCISNLPKNFNISSLMLVIKRANSNSIDTIRN